MKKKVSTRPVFNILLTAVLVFSLAACSGPISISEREDRGNNTSSSNTNSISNSDSIKSTLQELQSNLNGLLLTANRLVDSTRYEDVLNQSTLDTLTIRSGEAKVLIEKTDAFLVEYPGAKDDLQATELQGELRDAIGILDAAITAVNTSKQDLIKAQQQAQQAALEAAITPRHTYTITITDYDGYKMRCTITISDWIRGSEKEMLQSAWAKVKGTGSMPLTAGSYRTGPYGGSYSFIDVNSAAYVFGTVSFTYLTTDYAIQNFARGNVWVGLDTKIKDGNSELSSLLFSMPAISAIQYSTRTDFSFSNYDFGSLILVRPGLEANNWGPAPFVIAVDKVFTPAYPNGNPQFDSFSFRLNAPGAIDGERTIRVDKTW